MDRFLEHSRIFHFRNGGDEEVYLSSADWMPRNLDRRIELLFPVGPDSRQKVLDVLDAMFLDNVKSRRLMSDGSYKRRRRHKGDEPFRAQVHLYREAAAALERARAATGVTFEPITLPEAAVAADGRSGSGTSAPVRLLRLQHQEVLVGQERLLAGQGEARGLASSRNISRATRWSRGGPTGVGALVVVDVDDAPARLERAAEPLEVGRPARGSDGRCRRRGRRRRRPAGAGGRRTARAPGPRSARAPSPAARAAPRASAPPRPPRRRTPRARRRGPAAA